VKVLIDTHTMIWLDGVPSMLSTVAAAICVDPNNELIISMVSLWEIQIKLQLGKLTLHSTLEGIVERQFMQNRARLVSIEFEHVLELAKLPALHRDPFDRMLIAQARVEQAVLLTKDAQLAQYPIQTIW